MQIAASAQRIRCTWYFLGAFSLGMRTIKTQLLNLAVIINWSEELDVRASSKNRNAGRKNNANLIQILCQWIEKPYTCKSKKSKFAIYTIFCSFPLFARCSVKCSLSFTIINKTIYTGNGTLYCLII